MKQLISVLLLLFIGYSQALKASETRQLPAYVQDTVYLVKHDTVWIEKQKDSVHYANITPGKYDRRVHRYRKHWQALIPTYSKLQFAGNMGLLSIGPGWNYGKRDQWETDLLFGFIPKYESKKHKVTMTIKQNFIPWSLTIKDKPVSVEPLSCGMYFNTVFGDEFWSEEPERFPKGYYGFSSKVRIHVFLGQRLTFDIPPKYRRTARQITFFYEVSTCDLYLVSAFTNSYLKPKDYLALSFGLKMQFL